MRIVTEPKPGQTRIMLADALRPSDVVEMRDRTGADLEILGMGRSKLTFAPGLSATFRHRKTPGGIYSEVDIDAGDMRISVTDQAVVITRRSIAFVDPIDSEDGAVIVDKTTINRGELTLETGIVSFEARQPRANREVAEAVNVLYFSVSLREQLRDVVNNRRRLWLL